MVLNALTPGDYNMFATKISKKSNFGYRVLVPASPAFYNMLATMIWHQNIELMSREHRVFKKKNPKIISEDTDTATARNVKLNLVSAINSFIGYL